MGRKSKLLRLYVAKSCRKTCGHSSSTCERSCCHARRKETLCLLQDAVLRWTRISRVLTCAATDDALRTIFVTAWCAAASGCARYVKIFCKKARQIAFKLHDLLTTLGFDSANSWDDISTGTAAVKPEKKNGA